MCGGFEMKKQIISLALTALLILALIPAAAACAANKGAVDEQDGEAAVSQDHEEDSRDDGITKETVTDAGNEIKTSLIGFWHSSPNFSGGFEEFYRFFDDGEGFEYEGADGTLCSGYWDVKDGSILELTSFVLDGDEYVEKPTQSYDIEYVVSDAGEETAIIGGRKFWRLHEPVDVINGIPLYIHYRSDDGKRYQSTGIIERIYQSSEVIYVPNPHTTGDNVIFSYNGDLYDFKIVVINMSFDNDDIHFSYGQDDIIFELEHLSPNSFVNYENVDIGTMYAEAFTFCDASGTCYAYAMWHGGRGGGPPNIGKIDPLNY
jgi:hypothetical protein